MEQGFNTFDFIIVAISIVDAPLSIARAFISGPDILEVFNFALVLRTFRIFRILRLAKGWKGLQVTLNGCGCVEK